MPGEDLINSKKSKLEKIKQAGINPYPSRYERSHLASEAQKLKVGTKKVRLAGRLMLIRDMGRLCFTHLQDGSGRIQLAFNEKELGREEYKFFVKNFDIGDIIGVEGEIFKTKRGEQTLLVKKYSLLAKSLQPLPEKWHGLSDKEERYRKRYLDLIMNPEIKEVFIKKQQIFDAVREFLNKQGFIEVDTPVLQPIYGGTNARPFDSKLNALNMKVYMRISNEMYLKRLIVGGFEKIFEFSKDFRNEGIDRLHNPEFTQVETMWAYADYEDNMKLWEELIGFVVKKLFGKTKIKTQGKEIDFKKPWRRIKFLDALRKFADADFSDIKRLEEAQRIAERLKIDAVKCTSVGQVMIRVFEDAVQEKLIQPTIVYDYPKEATVLAKSGENKDFVKAFELIINGWEIAFCYCEENDPRELERKWKEQEEALRKGDQEAQRMDPDFIEALEIGMPPVSGIGMGMDRLVMILTNQPSIRDVILFPFMKPREEEND